MWARDACSGIATWSLRYSGRLQSSMVIGSYNQPPSQELCLQFPQPSLRAAQGSRREWTRKAMGTSMSWTGQCRVRRDPCGSGWLRGEFYPNSPGDASAPFRRLIAAICLLSAFCNYRHLWCVRSRAGIISSLTSVCAQLPEAL